MTSRHAAAGAIAAVLVGGTVVAVDHADERCVSVDLDNQRHAHVLDHAWDAIDAGHPAQLTIKRSEVKANRRASLRGIPTRPGYDRDEYPPAVSDEGGAGADVRYVASVENRSAGSLMGRQLRARPDGSCFRLEERP